MKKTVTLTQDAFDKLLAWLDADREQAGDKYEQIRHKLIRLFMYRGCREPEDLADETINRVARRADDISANYVGDPSLYFYGVAHKVHHEYLRKKPVPVQPFPIQNDEQEQAFQCLEHCMQQLNIDSRDLILQYYSRDKTAKIDMRKDLANQKGIARNALRNRAHRIRVTLQHCVMQCLNRNVVQ